VGEKARGEKARCVLRVACLMWRMGFDLLSLKRINLFNQQMPVNVIEHSKETLAALHGRKSFMAQQFPDRFRRS
jgi:hypothetical protein